MQIRSKCLASFTLAAALVTMTPPARGQVPTSAAAVAELLYNEGQSLVKEGKYAEACPKFERSEQLDPSTNTKANLANCYVYIGRLGSAWVLFQEVATAMSKAGNATNEAYARRRMQELAPRLPMLKIVVPPGSPTSGLSISRNGEPIGELFWGQNIPVDPGDHSIKATAPGKKEWEQVFTTAEGKVTEVPIPILQESKPIQVPPKDRTRPNPERDPQGDQVRQPRPSLGLRYGAIGASALGLGGIVLGSIYGFQAKSQWDEATSLCPAGYSPNNPCPTTAREPQNNAKTSATISTVGFVAGGVGIAAAVTLWILSAPSSPKSARAGVLLLPSVGPGYAVTTVRARF